MAELSLGRCAERQTKRAQNLKPGPVRRSAVSLDAAPPRDGMTGGERAAGNLLGEPGLADARFADDEHEPPHPVRSVAKCRAQHRELVCTADQGARASGLAR
jgi:hypothetical protein